MLIKQVRLKNIKSFGEGEDGHGVTVGFDRGLNRIGGKNGAGKSSIIEAIGYALFDAEPIRGDNRIQVGTYLVRDGIRTGEIDVWIETGDGIYRVERDAGRMARRWKVLREDDGFAEAEGNDEVQRFLARLFGVSGPERLSELFHSLIGVKQGRFTTYFDCKTSEAKAHFDPLLDVDIFRKCFEDLLEPLKIVQKMKTQLENAISEYSGGIGQLIDAPEQTAVSETVLQKATVDSGMISQAVEAWRLKLAAHENTRQQKFSAEQKYTEAQGVWNHAQTIREGAAKEAAESTAATHILETALPGFKTYQAADHAYQSAEAERVLRDKLVKEESAIQLNAERLNAEKRQRMETITAVRQEIELKQSEGSRRRAEAQNRNIAHQSLLGEVAQQAKRHEAVGRELDGIKEWRITLQEQKKRFEAELVRLVQQLAAVDSMDPQGFEQAGRDYETAVRTESDAKVALAKAEQEREQLAKQLESIQGGVCPFLGERCQQFSPDRIRDQITASSANITGLTDRWHEAAACVQQEKTKLDAAQTAQNRLIEYRQAIRQGETVLRQCYRGLDNAAARQLAERLDHVWPGAALPEIPVLGDQIAVGVGFWQEIEVKITRVAEALQANVALWNTEYVKLGETYQASNAQKEKENAWLVQEAASLKQLGAEVVALQKRVEDDQARIAALDRSWTDLHLKLVQVQTQLQNYPNLDAKMATLRGQLEEYRGAYTLYLQNQPLAEKLSERQARLEQAVLATAQGEQELTLVAAQLEKARAAFDEPAFAADQQEYQKTLAAQGEARSDVARAETELIRQKERVTELTNLRSKRQHAWEEFDRLDAQSILLDKARNVLKNSQGLVAQGLASRIQGLAQAIYNAMSPEPAQFEWSADDYKLTVRNASGERRFTQLSGGQQMKAAIAMQLALVKEFSKAGICAFDEPTYGLDVESRQMLADAIATVYHECNFDQLFVVSHDASFDDKVEHVVDLKYSGTKGTVVEEVE